MAIKKLKSNVKHFTIEEFSHSNTAELLKIDNTPPFRERMNLENLVEKVLDPLREMWGQPIIVNSGYRNERVNRIVGGARNSQHMKGEAADIRPVYMRDIEKLYKLAKEKCNFDQLLFEYTKSTGRVRCIHISCKPDVTKNRHFTSDHYEI